jgi:hypothetical protein
MASNINPYNINGAFPVAGEDNSSQGFRDNFTNIKNNFLFAQNELNDLQSKVLLTGALNGQTINNDMAGAVIRRPQLSAWTQALYDLGAISTSATLDFNQANFQKITSAGSINLSFANWPTSSGTGALGYGSMRVWIVLTSAAHTITLPASVSVGVNEIVGYNPDNHTITFDVPGNYIFDFSSIDGGTNYLIFDATRNHATFRDPSFYLNNIDAVSPTVLVGYDQNSLQTALALEQGQDVISVRGSLNSVMIGNLATVNANTLTYNDGVNSLQGVAGYSITSTRGNIYTGVFANVENNDMLGYVSSFAYTPTVGNTNQYFVQTAGMRYYAKGANVYGGIGGNIAFFTAQSGRTNANVTTQALGIENDQSARFFGNVVIDKNVTASGNIIVANVYVPTSSTSGGTVGQISYDSGNVYICLGPNNWKKATLSTF